MSYSPFVEILAQGDASLEPLTVDEIVGVYFFLRLRRANAILKNIHEDLTQVDANQATFEQNLRRLAKHDPDKLREVVAYFDAWSADMRRMVDEAQGALDVRSDS